MFFRVLAAIALLTSPGVAMAEPIAHFIESEMKRTDTPGVSVAVVHKGQILRMQGFGLANIEHNVPVHPDTVFKLGATGMQFTAAAIMLLHEDGKLDLDAPVTNYLPAAPEKWNKVTLRQLLDHTSGLPATPNGDFRADYTQKELLGIIGRQELNFPAGTRWRFSYSGYIVLGFVIENVTGRHWTEFMEHRIFDPLGMQSARGIDELKIIPNRAAGYELRNGTLRNAEWISPTANSTADGSLYMSVLDYAIWSAAVSRKQILGSGSWDELGNRARLQNGNSCSYAPGWFQQTVGAHHTWWHSGNWQGFQTYALRYPEQDLTIAIFANGEGADVQRLAHGVAGLVDTNLVRASAQPLRGQNNAVTGRVEALVGAISKGTADYAEFSGFAKLDFTELAAQYGGLIGDLGKLNEIALFELRENCGESVYRYRARFEKGLVEIRLGLAPNGKIGSLEMLPLSEWSEPL